MKLSKTQYYTLFWIIIIFILISSIFKWIDYLTDNKYIMMQPISIQEYFTGSQQTDTSHTVNLPLTTTYSCQNFCGPTARCSITGQQCSADIDCPGCEPYSPPLKKTGSDMVPGYVHAGKLTWSVTPQYSPLTNGYGTDKMQITSNMYSKPAVANLGVDKWFSQFKKEKKLFNKRYKTDKLDYMPNYPERYSLTGKFIEDGPFASNASL